MVDQGLTVLVVDDTEGCRELFELWLGEDHTVRTAAGGERALEKLDPDVDMVFLDRNMPGMSGREVADEIGDSEHDPHVVMVSSMTPDFDIVSMPIDEYYQKPVTETDIQTVLEEYASQQAYRTALDELFSLTAKLATVEANKSASELEASEEYARLKRAVATKRATVDEALATTDTDWDVTFQSCTDGTAVENTSA